MKFNADVELLFEDLYRRPCRLEFPIPGAAAELARRQSLSPPCISQLGAPHLYLAGVWASSCGVINPPGKREILDPVNLLADAIKTAMFIPAVYTG